APAHGACVDRDALIDEEARRPVTRRLPTVAAEHPDTHGVPNLAGWRRARQGIGGARRSVRYVTTRRTAAASRGIRGTPAACRRRGRATRRGRPGPGGIARGGPAPRRPWRPRYWSAGPGR